MSTNYEALAPELRLALRAACEVSNPVERGRRRAQQVTSRLVGVLTVLAAGVAAVNVLLLIAN